MVKKLTTKQKENLANEILSLLKDYNLNEDIMIYFNNKCLQGDGTIIENVKGSDKFEYATDDTLSMTFDGDFYDVINYNLPSLHNKIYPLFAKLLGNYGLFYELGHKWNLFTYYIEPDAYPDVQEEIAGESFKNPICIKNECCPYELEPIRVEWERRQTEHGEDGTCVIGAGFRFKFKNLYYRMPPQGPYQGCCSWEASKDIIQEKLIAAGCKELIYEDGRMD